MGNTPNKMYSFCKGIVFLEQLKTAGFTNAFFVAIAPPHRRRSDEKMKNCSDSAYMIILYNKWRYIMHNEFTAIVEKDEGWFFAYSPEIPGANGQGKTKDEALGNLSQAIDLILVDRREDAAKGLPKDAERLMVAIG
ncbi:MAG: type II toxin-antitoxin system HicB family antitoxin [Kiritimatiellae bacterium]|nr:type II toxin-antitoxin system HicB family antitoxin [Kiritimatiellia bacterium]